MRPHRASQPLVTISLLALCIVVFALEVLASPPPWNLAITDVDLEALLRLGGTTRQLTTEQGEWWRLLTAVLLHGGIVHILFNGWNLYSIGGWLEQRAGPGAVLSGFVWTGLAASLASNSFGASNAISVGASGAIFGLFGFLATHGVRSFAEWLEQIRLNAVRLAVIVAVSALIPNVDNWAHIGGLLAGLALGFFWERLPGLAKSLASGTALVALVFATWKVVQGFLG